MGEIASGVATALLEKLATKAYQDIALAWGLQDDVEKLQRSMIMISAFLKDAENKTKSNGTNEWVQQFKQVFLDAGDVLDEIECEALRNEVINKSGSISRKVRRFFSSSNQVAFSIKMAHKIKEIRERIEDIAPWGTKLGLIKDHHTQNFVSSEQLSMRETHSRVEPSHVIGRDEEKEKIIDYLISPQSLGKGIDAIPIVGIGGLGKTTLAKLVYNDERVGEHFDLKAWVCVSDEFDVKRIALGILKSLGREGSNNENLQQVQTRLHNELHQKTFLVVMDDVWNYDRKKWQELTTLMADNCAERNKNSSKIIITTRDNQVAAITRTTSAPQFYLRGLTEDESLKVFLGQAFPAGEEIIYPRLVEIGKEIVKKCKGVPLAVVSLGCVLYSKTDESEWQRVRDNEIWKLEPHDDGILPALRLSYNHLPPSLKQCVSYCSIFPKDYLYSNERLISFWLAHGLLESSEENAEPEDLGHRYINELLSRFFFQDLEVFYLNPGFFTFKMHDLVHDLAMSTMQSEFQVVTSNSVSINEKARHLLISEKGEGVLQLRPLPRKVRTCGFWPADGGENIITEQFVTCICNQFEYLRVLDLRDSILRFLPDCFSEMKHLRYLYLPFCSKMEELPESICKLQNLQMLDVSMRWGLKKLPKKMKYLVSLRVLRLRTRESNLSNCGIWSLESLQILYLMNCYNLISLPSDLSHLTSLKKLCVWNCLNLINFEEEREEGEKGNREVKDLSLRVFSIQNLPKLTTLPHWLKRSAKTMQYIDIDRCPSLTVLPEWLPNLTALEKLCISDCPELVVNCQKEGPDRLKIAHVPNVFLDDVKQNWAEEQSSDSASVEMEDRQIN